MSTLIDLNEAARRLSCSPSSLRAWAGKKLITTVKIGRRRLVPVEEVERLGREGLTTSAKEKHRASNR